MKTPRQVIDLWTYRDSPTNVAASRARDALLRTVLAQDGDLGAGPNIWKSFGFFTSDGVCVATLDAASLSMTIDGVAQLVGAIRSVATDPDWRGRGLFRRLLGEALAWLASNNHGLTLLFTAEPDIYRCFGFREVPQHAFVGAAPARAARAEACRRLDVADASDRRLIEGILARRGPVSARCALRIDADQYLYNLARNSSLAILHLIEADALIVHEMDQEELVIVDVAAACMPGMARLVGASSVGARRVKTLFPPDLLDWPGRPVPESTGLMIRGELPRALMEPFMLPPTAEF